ncbi:hypothetical protein [Sphaerotilus sp.]|uniref:hypothetical protein n=1 Tax=Sphaerotilus sp. TaxID=2093942 RepID=UPI002ACE3702|nr:hypothetical protein [Sphaerotilus sp.]MDZ7858219.1 hypothetical protein [Sphaerotilus sp.]
MTGLARDLLEQASFLCGRERKRPKQASLRRAVSSAYYALFHLLIEASVAHFGSRSPMALRRLMARAYSHGDMLAACKHLALGTPPPHLSALLATPVEADLRLIATAFVELQDQRHRADYDLSAGFTRIGVDMLITKVEDAFQAWERVAGTHNAKVFLSALLLGKAWKR